jgi:hypothetical protein
MLKLLKWLKRAIDGRPVEGDIDLSKHPIQ